MSLKIDEYTTRLVNGQDELRQSLLKLVTTGWVLDNTPNTPKVISAYREAWGTVNTKLTDMRAQLDAISPENVEETP